MIYKKKRYEARRFPSVDWSGSRATAGPPESFEIVGADHPYDDRKVELLPGDVSTSDARYFLTYDERLRTADEERQDAADEVRIDGDWYRVHAVKRTPPPMAHFECILIRRQAV